MLRAVLAAPAHEEADARLRLEVDDEVGIVLELALAVGGGEGRQLQARRQLDEHFLERLALAGRRHDRHAHRIGRAVELGDRPVEHAHHVVALEVGRVGQHQVGEGDRLALERVADDEEGDLVLAVRRPCAFSISRTAMVFMVEFQAMLAMKISSVSSRYGSPRVALVITVCIRPCADSGCSQENAWSMRIGVPSASIAELLGVGRKAERRRVERRVRLDHVRAS